MSELYVKERLLVARAFYEEVTGLEDRGYRFFRSMKEFEEESAKHGWEGDKRTGKNWCVKPTWFYVLIRPSDLERFRQGNFLVADNVYFSGSQTDKLYRLGRNNTAVVGAVTA